jgi:hypothetical protein
MANEDDAGKKLRQAAVVVPIRPDLPQDLPLIDIFETMLAELKTEIDKASGFKFTSEKLDQSFDLEDLLDDQGNSKSNQEGTISSWIKEFIEQDELISQRSFGEEEMMTLITFLIRGCAIYGHNKGLRIGGFIEYSTATGDNYIIDAVMKISFREDYSDLEIDVEMAELMVSSLSGEELSLLMREQLNEELKNNGVNKELYDSDKYVWLQTIKDTVNQKIKGVKSTKSSLVVDDPDSSYVQERSNDKSLDIENPEKIIQHMQENLRESPDVDRVYMDRNDPRWSGLEYVESEVLYEEFIDNINDFGIHEINKVGDSLTFGQNVCIECVYQKDMAPITKEDIHLLDQVLYFPLTEMVLEYEIVKMLISGYKICFECGVEMFIGVFEVWDFEDQDTRGPVVTNFYDLKTGSHDPAYSYDNWLSFYSEVDVAGKNVYVPGTVYIPE